MRLKGRHPICNNFNFIIVPTYFTSLEVISVCHSTIGTPAHRRSVSVWLSLENYPALALLPYSALHPVAGMEPACSSFRVVSSLTTSTSTVVLPVTRPVGLGAGAKSLLSLAVSLALSPHGLPFSGPVSGCCPLPVSARIFVNDVIFRMLKIVVLTIQRSP